MLVSVQVSRNPVKLRSAPREGRAEAQKQCRSGAEAQKRVEAGAEAQKHRSAGAEAQKHFFSSSAQKHFVPGAEAQKHLCLAQAFCAWRRSAEAFVPGAEALNGRACAQQRAVCWGRLREID